MEEIYKKILEKGNELSLLNYYVEDIVHYYDRKDIFEHEYNIIIKDEDSTITYRYTKNHSLFRLNDFEVMVKQLESDAITEEYKIPDIV